MARSGALQHRRRRVRQAPARQARDDVGGLARQRALGELGRAAGPRGEERERAARPRRRARGPRRDAAAADAGDGRHVLRHLEGGGDPALDVGAVRGRGHPPPHHRLAGEGARHQRGQRRPGRPRPRRARDRAGRRPARRRLAANFPTVDTAADDPAQLYYSSGTTGLAKGILHAHRYVLAHEEFVYCHDLRDGELFHGMGEWAWAAGISPLLGPWRLGATQFVFQREGGFDPEQQLAVLSKHRPTNVFTTPTAMRAMMGVSEAGTRYPQDFRDRLLGRRAAEPGGDPLVPRPVRDHRARLLRPHGVLSAGRQLPVHGGARGLDGQGDAGLGRADPGRGRAACRARASAARSACVRGRTRTTRWATGTGRRSRRRRSAATGSTPRTRPSRTRTATTGTRAAPTT